MFTVYILYSQKYDQIYIGSTSDLPNRFLSHNELATKGHTIKFWQWKKALSEIMTINKFIIPAGQ
jgi:putative endonuclease